ncbi:DUF3467 domain-containing protein [Patescibacteria group bacterium]|nr:DUF3467 domain-containing protein [Patescibacteria group bacterium]MBU1889940.1 DUF3467 domain-containing protein [Patescibacteria group bacterium]
MQNQPQPNPNQQGKQIQIKVSDDVMKGTYANAMSIVHSKEEFTLDFMNIYPHQGAGIVGARIITSPGHMKRIITALQDNLKKYENQHGKIEEAKAPDPIGFKTA